MKITDRGFFTRAAVEAAPALLGKIICRRTASGKILRARITETECYMGQEDSASHAYRGKTERNKIFFEEGGKAYVYLCYGIHEILNITCGKKDEPSAVMLRSIAFEQPTGLSKHIVGPGLVGRALNVTRKEYGEDLISSKNIWLEDDGFIPPIIETLKRVGIKYAHPNDQDRLWRFRIMKV